MESLQVEINKRLFMDVRTFRKTDGFSRLRNDIDRLLRVVADDAKTGSSVR